MNSPQKPAKNISSRANIVALAFVFTLSFLTYIPLEMTLSLQLLPLMLFAVLVFFRVFWSDSVVAALWSLFEVDGILFVLFLSLFILGPSISSTYAKSAEFAVLLFFCLILARLYMAVVPIRDLLEAFFWSGIASVTIFIPLAFAGLMQSVGTLERFMPFGFHPNLLGFLLAGYSCALLWKFMTARSAIKVLAATAGFACLTITFLASSRGSILAILVGCIFVAGMEVARLKRGPRMKFFRLTVFACALLVGSFFLVRNLEWIQNALSYVDTVLELSNDYRGIYSGFSGRLDAWNQALRVFADGTFLIGRGIRYSDFSATVIDNSYLVLLYEVGLIPLVLIVWRFLGILRVFIRSYFRSASPSQRYFYLGCTLLMVVLLVNNIFARYLFGIGNPFSLLSFLLFAAPTWQIEQRLSPFASRPGQSVSLVNLP